MAGKKIERRVWKSDGPRNCKVCKAMIVKGDDWVSGTEHARAHTDCIPDLSGRIARQEAAERRAEAAKRLAAKYAGAKPETHGKRAVAGSAPDALHIMARRRGA